MPQPPGRHRCRDSPFAAGGHVIDLSDEEATNQEVSGILNKDKLKVAKEEKIKSFLG